MKTRTLGFAAAVALTLAACGSDSDDINTVDPATPGVAQTEGTDDSGSGDEPVTGDDNATDDDDMSGDDDDMTRGGDDDDMTDSDDEGTADDGGAATGEAPERSIDLNGYEFDVSLEEAIEISDGETGGGTIYHVGMNWSNGAGWVWEIETLAGTEDYELEINATTGEIYEVERDDEDDNEQALELDSVIRHQEAMEIAVAEASGQVTEWDLDWDDGRQEYDIEIGDDIDVTIDAMTGEVIEVDN